MALNIVNSALQNWANISPRSQTRSITPTATGSGSGASQFTAANSQNFTIPSNTSLQAGKVEFYLAGWAYFDAVNVQQTILIKGTSLTSTGCEYAIWLTSAGVLRFTMSDGSTTVSLTGPTLTAGTWYFIEAAYDSANNRERVAVNRGTSLSVAQTAGTGVNTLQFSFGSDGTIDYFGGRLFSWGLWKGQTYTTVNGYMDFLYNSGAGRTYADLTSTQKTGLVSWWDFGESTGNLLDKNSTNNMTPSASRATVGSSPSGGAGAASVSILTPLLNQIVPRKTATTGDIPITGTYAGAPTDIEARWNGGAWKPINATGSGGTFKGVLTGQTVAANALLEVRFQNNTTVTGSKTIGGIGILIALWGQSNCSGRGTNLQTFTAGMAPAYLFGNDYVWKPLADAVDSSTSQVDTVSSDAGAAVGSVWPLVATQLSANNAIPIAFVPCPKGGTSSAQWQPNSDNFLRTSLFGSALYRTVLTGCEIVLWWQGETDMQAGQTQAYYQTNFETIAATLFQNAGIKIMPCKVQTLTSASGASSAMQLAINNAISFEWANNTTRVLTGPDLTVITCDSSDGLHLNSDANLASAANLWVAKLKTALGLS